MMNNQLVGNDIASVNFSNLDDCNIILSFVSQRKNFIYLSS